MTPRTELPTCPICNGYHTEAQCVYMTHPAMPQTTLSTLIPRLAELEAKATKGPWKTSPQTEYMMSAIETNARTIAIAIAENDLEFIALLHNTFPALLSERQALREALEAALTVIHHTPACDKHLTEQCTCGAASACLTISAALSLADKPI